MSDATQDFTDPIRRTVHELSRREREAAVAAFKRAHDAEPDWGLPSDRAWIEGFAAGCFETGTGEIADLRNVIQAACTQGGLAAMAQAWAKYFPDHHPITVAGLAPATPITDSDEVTHAVTPEEDAAMLWLGSVRDEFRRMADEADNLLVKQLRERWQQPITDSDAEIERMRQWFIEKHACWFTASTLREAMAAAGKKS